MDLCVVGGERFVQFGAPRLKISGKRHHVSINQLLMCTATARTKEVMNIGREMFRRRWRWFGLHSPNLRGRRCRWPKGLRAMAVERAAAGEEIGEIAEEIGLHNSLVAAWMKSAKIPTFLEVVLPTGSNRAASRPERFSPRPAGSASAMPISPYRGLFVHPACLNPACREVIAVISPSGHFRIFPASEPVDFRKGMDELVAYVADCFDLDSLRGAIFVFRSRRADRLKLLVWNGTGLVLTMERLDGNRFTWPKPQAGTVTLL